MEIAGKVVKEMFGGGSKSERGAVMLDTGESKYVLRREGGNPFADSELDSLIGKSIRGQGILTGYTFIMSDWTIESDPPS